ncbi:MAG: autotransporter outer membrane beta-barrel domain-containing protein [Planctomycetaceae bacterium]|nr:autotransporter outer membrane beta-barrel domain-containing protein [Planctomycetaceae bacterium]
MCFFIASSAVGDEFSLRLFDCQIDNIDDKVYFDQSEFYRCSDKINNVTIIPQFWHNINSKSTNTDSDFILRQQTSNNNNENKHFLQLGGSDEKSLQTWISGFGSWTGGGNDVSNDEYKFYSSGFAVGIDRLVGRSFLVGMTLGWDKTTIDLPNLSKETFTAGHGHLYFRTTFRRLYVDVESGVGFRDGKKNSQIGLPQNTTLQWNFQIETGTWWDEGLLKIEPFAQLQHASLFLADLRDPKKTTAIAGVRCSWQSLGLFYVSTPRIYGGIIHELGDSNVAVSGLFTDSSTIFVAQNRKIAGTRLFAGCGITSSKGSTMNVYFRYTAEAATHYASHSLLIGMKWIF